MKQRLFVIIACVGIVALVLGCTGFSFSHVKAEVESVQDSSKTILQDISSISLFAFSARDLFSGADSVGVAFMERQSEGAGAYGVHYRSIKDGKVMNEEYLPISTVDSPMTSNEAYEIYERITYPLEPVMQWSTVEYNGLFADTLNALQYIAYVIGMIWAIIAIVTLVVVDTVVTAWSLIKVAFSIVGLA